MPDTLSADDLKKLWALGRTPPTINKDTLEVEIPSEPVNPHVFVHEIVNAAKISGVGSLQGFISGSLDEQENTAATHVRLYTSLEFAEYVEVEKGGIVLIVDMRTPFSSMAGQAMWVKDGTDIVHGQSGVKTQRLQSEFLRGNLGGDGAEDRGGRWSPGCGRWSPGCGRWSPGCGRWSPAC